MNEEQYARVKGAAELFVAMGGHLRTGGWGFSLDETENAYEPTPSGGWRHSPHQRVVAKNVRLRDELRPCLCPMAALLLCEQPDVRHQQADNVCAKILATRRSLIESFISGWDGSSPYKGHEQAPGELRTWYMAGRRMRGELGAKVVSLLDATPA